MIRINWNADDMCAIVEDGVECGCVAVERHHIIHGDKYNKRFSETYGFYIPICRRHHAACHHTGAELDRELKIISQTKFEEEHTREEWMEVVGRSYI